jgi:hypothetical protein
MNDNNIYDIKSIKIDEINKYVLPLDCIFFNTNSIYSSIIKKGQNIKIKNRDIKNKNNIIKQFTHVGIVINKKIMTNLRVNDNDELYLYESTISNKQNENINKKDIIMIYNDIINKYIPINNIEPKDIEKNKCIWGVQIRKLKDVIKFNIINNDDVYWCKLKNNPYNNINSYFKINKIMNKIHYKFYHTKYQTNPINLMATVYYNCLPPIKKFFCNNNKVFCSQFVCIVYNKLNITNIQNIHLITPYELYNNYDLFFDIIKIIL